MQINRFSRLLERELVAEGFVRSALGCLEAEFREIALFALHDWSKSQVVSNELFSAMASLQRPSWGTWNGLLSSLRSARKAILQSGDVLQRERIEKADALKAIISTLDFAAEPALLAALRPLGMLTRTPLGSKLKLSAVLAMPISLRNRIAHDSPTDPEWWEQVDLALRPLIEYNARHNPTSQFAADSSAPGPWFLVENNQTMAFNGIEHDFAVLYVNEAGVSRASPERAADILLAFQAVLGKAGEHEKDFKKLLSKHAPEEIRGVIMGDWLVGRRVREGNFANVHVGRQLSTGRKVAIKILNDGLDADTTGRFLQEAAFLTRLRHPHIVAVYGFGQDAWSAPHSFSISGEAWFDAFAKGAKVKTFIALEWIEGRTLDEIFHSATRVAAGKPTLATLARWMAEAADAVSVVHVAGLLHRDIKPHNLMVTQEDLWHLASQTEGVIKLMDFGIARSIAVESLQAARPERVPSIRVYMSPEQILAADSDGEIGPASDVYSLAATFFELFTERRLHQRETPAIAPSTPAKIPSYRQGILKIPVHCLPWEIETILLGGLEPEAADRYRSMAALERDLRHFLADEPIEYKRPTLFHRSRLVYRRNRPMVNLIGVFIALLIVGTLQYIHSIRLEQKNTAAQRDLAIRNGNLAAEQSGLAVAREKEGRLRLAALLSANGHALLDKNDPAGALLWYVRSLPLAADAPQQERMIRLRIGMTLRQLPRPIAMWGFPLQPRHAVYVSAISPHGRLIATGEAWITPGKSSLADATGGLRFFDAASGRLAGKTIDQPGMVTALCFSGDASRLVSISGDAARVYEVPSGRLLLNPQKFDSGVALARLSANGGRLLTVSGDRKQLRLIDINANKSLFDDLHFDLPLSQALLSDDGIHFLVTNQKGGDHSDGVIAVYDVTTGRQLGASLTIPSLWAAVISPSGHLLGTASGEGWARVYDLATLAPRTPPLAHSGVVNQIAFSSDSQKIATASADKTARIWSTLNGAAITASLGHLEAPYALGFSEDGTRLATFAYDKGVRIWDTATGFCLSPPLYQTAELQDGLFERDHLDHIIIATQAGVVTWDYSCSADPGMLRVDVSGDTARAAISPDSTRIALSSSAGKVRVLEAKSGQVLSGPLVHLHAVTDVAFAPDGRRLLTLAKDGARIWDLHAPAAQSTLTLKTAGDLSTARFSGDGRRVVTASVDTMAQVWDSATGEPVGARMAHSAGVNDAAFSPNGQSVATASADGNTRLWDSWSGSPTTQPMKNASAVSQVRFSPDGKLLLVPDDGGHVRLWNLATGKSLFRTDYGTAVREVSFSPDAKRFLAAGFSNFVKIYDTAAPQSPLAVLPSGPFSSYAQFGTDGSMVYTASFSGSRLWDASGSPLGPVLWPAPLRFGVFSPDGQYLVTTDTKVRCWDIRPDEHAADFLEQYAQLLASRRLDVKGLISPLSSTDALKIFERLQTSDARKFLPRPGASTQTLSP